MLYIIVNMMDLFLDMEEMKFEYKIIVFMRKNYIHKHQMKYVVLIMVGIKMFYLKM